MRLLLFATAVFGVALTATGWRPADASRAGAVSRIPAASPPPIQIPREIIDPSLAPLCRQYQASMGATLFKKRFGSVSKCVATLKAGVERAIKTCRTARDLDAATRCLLAQVQALAKRIAGGGSPGAEDTEPEAGDTVPPKVRAFGVRSSGAVVGVLEPGQKVTILYGASDNEGTVKVRLRLYQGGKLVSNLSRTVKGANLTSVKRDWPVQLARNLIGPLFYCVGAEDLAGNRTSPFPNSKCYWLSLLVPEANYKKAEINGCGGKSTWETLEGIQNYLGNKHTYQDSNVNPLATSYEVSFLEACNLHDAGYAGYTVEDPISNSVVDFRRWSRRQVDTKFLADMRKACAKKIPASAPTALKNCQARGGNVSFGAETLYNIVHEHGWRFFDADLTKPGLQSRGHRRNHS